jgi:hypothetical protein
MNVKFVTSIAPIAREAEASRPFYRDCERTCELSPTGT